MSELEPVYLVTGSDRPKVSRALDRLKSRVGRDSVEHLSARDTTGPDAVAACNTMGLFGGGESGRLVLVSDVERWKVADARAVGEYVAAPAPGAVLALVGDVKPDSALAKAVAKTPALRKQRVLVFDIVRRRLPAWVVEQFARHGVGVRLEAARRLVELVGEHPEALERDVDKIVTWARGEEIGESEIERLAAALPDAKGYEVADAWGRRDRARSLALSEALLEGDARPRRDAAAGLGALLAAHARKVARARTLKEAGVSSDRAKEKLDYRFPWQARAAYEQADRFSVEELGGAIVRFAALDAALKGASRLAGDLELERALVDLTDAPGTAGS